MLVMACLADARAQLEAAPIHQGTRVEPQRAPGPAKRGRVVQGRLDEADSLLGWKAMRYPRLKSDRLKAEGKLKG